MTAISNFCTSDKKSKVQREKVATSVFSQLFGIWPDFFSKSEKSTCFFRLRENSESQENEESEEQGHDAQRYRGNGRRLWARNMSTAMISFSRPRSICLRTNAYAKLRNGRMRSVDDARDVGRVGPNTFGEVDRRSYFKSNEGPNFELLSGARLLTAGASCRSPFGALGTFGRLVCYAGSVIRRGFESLGAF